MGVRVWEFEWEKKKKKENCVGPMSVRPSTRHTDWPEKGVTKQQ